MCTKRPFNTGRRADCSVTLRWTAITAVRKPPGRRARRRSHYPQPGNRIDGWEGVARLLLPMLCNGASVSKGHMMAVSEQSRPYQREIGGDRLRRQPGSRRGPTFLADQNDPQWRSPSCCSARAILSVSSINDCRTCEATIRANARPSLSASADGRTSALISKESVPLLFPSTPVSWWKSCNWYLQRFRKSL